MNVRTNLKPYEELKVSPQDIRDLANAAIVCKGDDLVRELTLILNGIIRKNELSKNAFEIV